MKGILKDRIEYKRKRGSEQARNGVQVAVPEFQARSVAFVFPTREKEKQKNTESKRK